MGSEEPPFLQVGTEVSAKYKGAFCEAKIKKINKQVKYKVTFKNNLGTVMVSEDQIRGTAKIGNKVEAKHPDKSNYVECVVNKMLDYSQYTVVFDDGDETTLRRNSLCLKSGRHFAESETLDQLPLTNPEHFSNPVLVSGKNKRKRPSPAREDDAEDDDYGKVVVVTPADADKRKSQPPGWFPALVVSPRNVTGTTLGKGEIFVRSFKDNKYHQVSKRDSRPFLAKDHKPDSNSLKPACEKALLYQDKNQLPPDWEPMSIHSDDEDNQEDEEDSSDDEPTEMKDRFVAQLYKFMEERGTPINKAPTIGSRDLNLHKLYHIVKKFGGFNKVTNQGLWKEVNIKMGLPPGFTTTTTIYKKFYLRYLHKFEYLYRRLGCTMSSTSQTGRTTQRSSAAAAAEQNIIVTRTRNKDTTPTQTKKQKKEAATKSEKEDAGNNNNKEEMDDSLKKKETRGAKQETPTKSARASNKKEDKAKEVKKEDKVKKEEAKPSKEASKKEEAKPSKEASKKEESKPSKEAIKKEEKPSKEASKKEEKPSKEASKKEEKPSKEVSKKEEKPSKEASKKEEKPSKEASKKEDKNKGDEEKKTPVTKATKKETPTKKKAVKEEKAPKKEDKPEKKSEAKPKAAVKEEKAAVAAGKRTEKEKKEKKEEKPTNKKAKPEDDSASPTKPVKKKAPPKTENEEKRSPSVDKKKVVEEDSPPLLSPPHMPAPEDTGRKNPDVDVGDRVQVKYYKQGQYHGIYKAKVKRVDRGPNNEIRYFVHYTGWNDRHDAWITPDCITDVIEKTKCEDKKLPILSKSTDPNSNAKLVGKRGRPFKQRPALEPRRRVRRKSEVSSQMTESDEHSDLEMEEDDEDEEDALPALEKQEAIPAPLESDDEPMMLLKNEHVIVVKDPKILRKAEVPLMPLPIALMKASQGVLEDEEASPPPEPLKEEVEAPVMSPVKKEEPESQVEAISQAPLEPDEVQVKDEPEPLAEAAEPEVAPEPAVLEVIEEEMPPEISIPEPSEDLPTLEILETPAAAVQEEELPPLPEPELAVEQPQVQPSEEEAEPRKRKLSGQEEEESEAAVVEEQPRKRARLSVEEPEIVSEESCVQEEAKEEEMDMSFLLCQEKVPASPPCSSQTAAEDAAVQDASEVLASLAGGYRAVVPAAVVLDNTPPTTPESSLLSTSPSGRDSVDSTSKDEPPPPPSKPLLLSPPKKKKKPRQRTSSESSSKHKHKHHHRGDHVAGEIFKYGKFYPKYNFLMGLDAIETSERKIQVLQERMVELKKVYQELKTEITLIDRRRRKKSKRKEKEADDPSGPPDHSSSSAEGWQPLPPHSHSSS